MPSRPSPDLTWPGRPREFAGSAPVPESRLRVGDWRVLLVLRPEVRVSVVMRILSRGRAYRD